MKNTMTRMIAGLAVLALLAGFAIGPAGSAFADAPAGGNASCMGFESWAVPPGTGGDEEPNGMQSVLALVDEAAAGGTRGSVISFLGQLHLGSHDEANPNDCP